MELIEKLDALVECGNDDYFNDGVYASMEVVAQHSDWVSVDERLPEHDKPVLVWVVSKAGNAYAFKAYYENSWHLVFGEVTHWQPLPQPPEQ